jgi:hypothetical protein
MRKQAIAYWWPLLVLLAAATTAAADNGKSSKAVAKNPGSGEAKDSKSAARDPVAAAFAVPRGKTFNDKQNQALKALKDKWEQKLRDAIEKTQKAEDAADKQAAAGEVRKITKDIRAEMQKIIEMPEVEAQRQATARQQEMARQQELLRQQAAIQRAQQAQDNAARQRNVNNNRP